MDRSFRAVVLCLACLLAVLGCSRQDTIQKTDTIMGTVVTVTVVSQDAREGEAAAEAALEEVRRLDRMMSLYKEGSEINRVNASAGERSVTVSPEMIEVALAARKASELTGGAFDATIGPLVVLWQMKLKQGTVPTDREIANVRGLVGQRNLLIDPKGRTLFLAKKGMVLDFGGVAKGYAADRAEQVVRKHGILNALIAVAGDIRAIGRREDGGPWRIGIQHPREKDRVIAALELSDRSVSTSGDYERFTIVGSKRYHHIIDPRTGQPSTGIEAVTVTGPSGVLIDPLTTALFILGPEMGMAIAREQGCEVLFVDNAGHVTASAGIPATK